ncbi:hypothetical protein [Clostridium minihomine]|uniref:hypothetical protein n=1 Tax=Clostridium minihomine TaxID=2045012 RepID=UPI000C756466|nr:hypothetical protein [Clostridium minihomine]
MKRFFALTLALCISLSGLAVFASSGGGGGTRGSGAGRFPDVAGGTSSTSWWKEHNTETAYSDFVQSLLDSDSYSIYSSNGSLVLPLKFTGEYLINNPSNYDVISNLSVFDDGYGLSFNHSGPKKSLRMDRIYFSPNGYVVPFNADVYSTFTGFLFSFDVKKYWDYYPPSNSGRIQGNVPAQKLSYATPIDKGTALIAYTSISGTLLSDDSPSAVSIRVLPHAYLYLKPRNVSDYISFNFPEGSRPDAIPMDLAIKDENEELSVISNPLLDFDANVFWNPVTNTTKNISSYAYDYSSRTYDLTFNSGDNIQVSYQDDSIVIYEGDSITNVYYYISSDSGSDSSETPGGGSDSGNSWGIVGDLLGKLITGIASFLGSILSAIISALTSLLSIITDSLGGIVSGILSVFEQFPPLFMGFASFLTAVFPFLPTEITSLLFFGLAAVVFVGILRFFLNR